MTAPRLNLRGAHEDNRAVTVVDKDGTVHEGVVVWAGQIESVEVSE